MSEGQPSRTAEREHLPPGAERFWGQVSETRAGRTRAGEEPSHEEPEAESEAPAEGGPACLEWCPICRSADLLRATTSPEAAIGQVQAIQHEAVNVLKSFLAAYSERGGDPERADRSANLKENDPARGGPDGSAPVRDISID
jgi:hypothetical protein